MPDPLLTRRACMGLSLWPALGVGQTAVPPDGSRVALVVGNSDYPDSPLRNPGNDARAMAELLGRAGFGVALHLDTTRSDLQQAITRFGQGLRDKRVRFAVFYYAGHGFQLDWRNHLVPVDARVRSAADVQRQTVDLGDLVRQLSLAQPREQGPGAGRSFLVILDACRDDPFAGSYRPPAKGLVPFDAPVGCVLAYATAPGRVAQDGDGGGNGLYTKHLLRELAVPEASIEDAFKRVRLNVRVESRGRQVPWEMASLEDPVYLFPAARSDVSDRERQRRFDDELLAWNRVRQAGDVSALVDFMRQFPSGNASELAQARLNRLLADEISRIDAQQRLRVDERAAAQLADRLHAQGQAAATAPAAPAPVVTSPPPPVPSPSALPPAPVPAAAPVPAEVPAPSPVGPGAAAPLPADVGTLPPNPYFTGQSALRRDYRVGQRLLFRIVDRFSQAEKALALRVTAVDTAADRVEFNGGEYLSDLMGNTLANPRGALSTPRQFYPAEFVLGRRWTSEFRQARPSGMVYTFRYKVRVAAREVVTVPAGRFDSWRIEAEGFNVGLSAFIKRTIWVAPGVAGDIAMDTFVRLRNGDIEQNDRQELVAVHPA
jgi:hypothetical protein